MKLKTFDDADWRCLPGAETTEDGQLPLINAEMVRLSDFPSEYRPWGCDANLISELEENDWRTWVADPQVVVIVDATGVSVVMGPDAEQEMVLKCTRELGILTVHQLSETLSLDFLLDLGFVPSNWGLYDLPDYSDKTLRNALREMIHSKSTGKVMLSVMLTHPAIEYLDTENDDDSEREAMDRVAQEAFDALQKLGWTVNEHIWYDELGGEYF